MVTRGRRVLLWLARRIPNQVPATDAGVRVRVHVGAGIFGL